MATPLTARAQLDALRAEGARVVEYRDWRINNRDHKGAWGPVNGVMIHHTVTEGTAPTVDLCYRGHSTLPGPLCHTVGAKDGTLYMVGHGRANHAGLGDGNVLQAVIAESTLPTRPRIADTDGNARFYGIELVNRGDGVDPWPAAQIYAAARWAAALCRAHGWNERSVIGHLEWQPGKVDPRGFSMAEFRATVRDLLTRPAGSAGTTTPRESSGMQLNDKVELGKWILDRWPHDEGLQDGSILVSTALGSGYAHSRTAADASRAAATEAVQLRLQVTALQKDVTRLGALVEALAELGGLTAAQTEAAATAGARQALAELGIRLGAGAS